MHHNLTKAICQRVPLLISALLLCYVASAQTTKELKDYAVNIIQFNKAYPQEKVYLHMDNRSYFIGDTIWFKAYVMDATTLHPTQTSGVLYVELLNEMGVEVEHLKMRLENGMCHGGFALKDEYRTGYYEIRAYTRYMLNWGNDLSVISLAGTLSPTITGGNWRNPRPKSQYDYIANSINLKALSIEEIVRMRSQVAPDPNLYIFTRVFPVYARPEILGEYKKEMEFYPYHTGLVLPLETNYELRPDNLELSFFPEGGALVDGVTSIVAFEATDQWGRKCEVEGYITEEKGKDIISNFKTTSRGRGVFPFCPTKGKKYQAHVTYRGKEYDFELPETDPTGCVLRVHPPMVGGDMTFLILCPPDMQSRPLAWTLQCRGALIDYDTLSSRASTTSIIPKERMKAGVNQLTVFDEAGNVLADRLFFVCPPRETVTLTTCELPDSLQPYEALNLDLRLQNKSGWPMQGHFSLSVTDADELEHDTYNTGDIRSELLLTSDIKGFVEDVDSYFHHTSDDAMVADIDMLMRVQGWRLHKRFWEWRRYNWHVMSGAEPFDYKYTPEKGLGIDGYIISEDIDLRKGLASSPYLYDRIPNLKVWASLNVDGIAINETGYADSTASYSIPFEPIFYGEVPMSILLEDTLSQVSHKRKKNRLINSQIVINRAFSPKPLSYSYYQHKRPSEDKWFDILVNDDDYSAERELQEVNIKKRRKRSWNIYIDRPELIIDYFKEWNFIIDRGTPWCNGQHVVSSDYSEDYRMNFPALTYSLEHLRVNEWGGFVNDDSISIKARNSYVMPKTIKVYSNILGREHKKKNDQSSSSELYYIIVERVKKSESPVYPPFLSKHGVRDTFYEGYSHSVEYYARDYSDCALPDTADYRRTLHWEPDVWTDNLGRASVSFYNNKRTKKLHVRAEGFTSNGEFIVYDSEKAD